MSVTITTRQAKGIALSIEEMDANLVNLRAAIEAARAGQLPDAEIVTGAGPATGLYLPVFVNGSKHKLPLYHDDNSAPPFTLSGVSPTTISTAGGDVLHVSGTGIAAPTCTVGGVSVTPANVTADGFDVTAPALAAGTYDVSVTVGGVTKTLPSAVQAIESGAGVTTYFADDFSSGDMLKTKQGADDVWKWGRNPQGTQWADIVTGFSRRGNVGNCVRLRWNTSGQGDELSGAGQPSVPAGCPIRFPLRVRVNWWDSTNSNRHFPQEGVQVTWSVVAGGGTLDATTSVTDSTGTAAMMYTAGPVAGTNTIRASLASGEYKDISFTSVAAVTPGTTPTTLSIVGGDVKINGVEQDKPKGCFYEEALRVKVTNAGGQGVAGVAVTWAVTSGDATIAFSSSTTDAQGIAYCLPKFGPTPGAVTITATAAGLTGSPATFTATALDNAGTITTVHTPNEVIEAKGSHEGEAQLAIGFGDWTERLMTEYWIYLPAGGEVIGGKTLNAFTERGRWRSSTFDYLGSANNKYHFAYEYYSDAVSRIIQSWTYFGGTTPPDAAIVPGWRPLGSTTYHKWNTCPQLPMFGMRRGYWHRLAVLNIIETEVNGVGQGDGYAEVRVDGVPVCVVNDYNNERRPADWVGPISGMTFINKFKYAYYMGYANSGFARETHAFISDYRAASDFIEDVPATHTITSVSPATAASAGGDTITVTGTGFTAESVVWFVPQALATDVISKPAIPSAQTATSLTVTAPAMPAGVYDVYVAQAGASVKRVAALTVS